MAKDQTTPPGLNMLAPEKEKEKEQADDNDGNIDNINEVVDDDNDDNKKITGNIGIIKKIG